MNPSRRIPIYIQNNNWILTTNECSLTERMWFIYMRIKDCMYLTNNYFVKFELMKHYILMERLFLSQKLGEIKACTLAEPFSSCQWNPRCCNRKLEIVLRGT